MSHVFGSSGSAVTAALRIAADWEAGMTIAVILPDGGRNYLSRIYSDEWMRDQGFLDGARRENAVPEAELLAKKPVRFGRIHTLHPEDRVRQAITALMALDISQLHVLADLATVGDPAGPLPSGDLIRRSSNLHVTGRFRPRPSRLVS